MRSAALVAVLCLSWPLLAPLRDPKPVEVKDGTIQEYGRWRLFNVEVFVNDRCVAVYGVDYRDDLDECLRGIALRFATSPKLVDDDGKPIPRPEVAVRIHRFNVGEEDWYHPGGKKMPDSWDGKLGVKVVVNCGSYAIE